MKKTLLLFLVLLSSLSMAFAQQREITGKVTASDDGTALPGVSVVVKGTTNGTSTDASGNFSIRVADNAAVLVLSYLGYVPREVPVLNQSTLNLSLTPDNQQLGEVVVTALGISREKRALGYATQEVKAEDISRSRQPNVLNALQGQVAGAQISSTGGAPGQGTSIRIRGVNSIDAGRSNEPLFVIDGVLMDNSTSTFGDDASLRGMSNRAADINPDDIASINILKGGAATALYGLRGANGVVVITTKKGQEGSFRVNFTSSFGVENVNKFPEVQRTYTQGYMGVYDPNSFWPAWGPTVAEAREIDPTHPEELYNNLENGYQTGKQYRNSLSFSGGTEKVTFLSSLSYLDHEGVLPFTDYKNFSARLNTEVKISEKFRTGANFNFINSGGYRYNADYYGESLAYFTDRWDVKDYQNPDGTQKSPGGNDNPLYGAATNRMKDNVNRFIGGLTFGYSPYQWLDFNYRVGLDTYTDNRLSTAPGLRGIPGENNSPNGITGLEGRGYVGEYNTSFRAINSTFVATLTHNFGSDLKATLRLGHDLYDRSIKQVGVMGADLTVFDWFNLGNAKKVTASQSESDYRLMGIFGEATLDYKDFLYLTLTGRNDVTSSLRSPNNSFFYPSVSLGYVFSEQFELPSFIKYGKLRLSYAKVGKDALPYSTSTGYSAYTSLASGLTGFTRAAVLGDPNLKPEFTNTYEAGLEMNFLNNRLGFDLTYYHSLSEDQIINIAVSNTTGYTNAAVNAGTMKNRGIEVVLNATPIQKGDFRWDTKLIYSANRNEVVSLREGLTEIAMGSHFGYLNAGVTMKIVPGQPYGNLYGTHYLRYYGTDTPDPMFTDTSRPMVIGANGFPVLAPARSQKILGNTQPDWIGGFTNTFSFKGLSLSAVIDARYGQEKYNQLENFYSAFGKADYTANRNEFHVFEGVLADGTPNTKQVWLGQGKGPDGVDYGVGYYRTIHRAVSEEFVQDASWIRLRTLTLNYSLPTAWLPQKFIKNASLSATGNNLWLSTDYYGYDPETSSFSSGSNVDGFSGFTYPAVRSFFFTLNVGF
ncbi:SusC/RagA family TonB-linked outer membrane protein [Rufibacter sp. XAAS-G3-1]|uniref:SusC/RagA family TonB-linked outer membrane protein n=1 Tax=Rufibacter sp. XAAS-G3-1 TaxID=2729134 RepID=UPI0015E7147D|nr:SusC/RagA family TonB-linked outer membrane protein [Rufibacter sp. XAAS-G3-1]